MTHLLLASLRVLLFVAGLGLAVLQWRTVGTDALSLGAGDPALLTLIVRASRFAAVLLVPPAFILLAVRPAFWRYALIPIIWTIVATIMVYPRELDFLFNQ